MRTLEEEAARIRMAMLERVRREKNEEARGTGKKVLVAKQIWDQFPVSPEEFMLSPDFLNDKRNNNFWPAIREDMRAIFCGTNDQGKIDYSPAPNLFLDCEGLGSGKSTKIALFVTYMVYWLHCLKNPYKYFGLSDIGTTMAIMNLAPNEEKAKRIVYNKVFAMMHSIPWFHDMGYMPDKRFRNELRFYKMRSNAFNKKELEYIDPFLVIRPSSGKAAAVVGEDLYAGIVDEAASDGGFELLDGTDKCEEIFEVMNTRRVSRFGKKGINMFISSAGTEDRWLEQMIFKVEEFRKANDIPPDQDIVEMNGLRVMYRRRPSYKANPQYKHSETFYYFVERETEKGVKVKYEFDIPMDFKRDMETRPEKTLRDIMALPTQAYSPFFSDMGRVRNACNKGRVDPLPDNGKDGILYPLCKKCLGEPGKVDLCACAWEQLPPWFQGVPGTWYYCHVDLGTGGTRKSGRDACGFAIAHRGPNVERGGIVLPTVVVDLSIRFKASKKKIEITRTVDGRKRTARKYEEIDISSVREFLVRLAQRRGFNFAKITYDGFQSLETLQTLQKMGYLAERAPCKKDTWDNMRSMWYDGRVDIFEDQWLMYEMSKLEDKGEKVDHAVGASNDEAEACARAIEMCIEGEMPDIKPPRARPRMGFGVANTGGRIMLGARRGGAARRGRGAPFFK